MNSVFTYLEYRDYLRDHFESQKQAKSCYSFRYLAAKTGIDASFYVKIINKQKHLGVVKIEVLAAYLGLDERETDYFTTLVHYNRTNDDQTAQVLFQRLMSLKNTCGLEVSDFRYFADWFTIPMREFLATYPFDGDYAKLAAHFIPPLQEQEARSAIETLTHLQMIAPDAQGVLRPTDAILTTGDQWRSAAVRSFQQQMIRMAAESLERIPKEDRDISTLTFSTTKACLTAIQDRLTQARREIMEMIAAEEGVDGVYQMNLQVFPLTRRVEL
jgi:uncharacterized protein (TIGR02147 family)